MPRKNAGPEDRQLRLLQGGRTAGVLGKGGLCNHLKSDKVNRCRNTAGLGTDHPGYGACRVHGGTAEAGNVHAARQRIADMAQEMQVDPVTALLSTVHMTAGMVAWLRNQIAHLEVLATGDRDEDESLRLQLRDLAELYSVERNNLAKMSKMAIDAGIAERQVQIAEAQAAMLVMAMRGVLDGLSLNDEQMALAPTLIRQHLLAIPATSSEAR